MNGARKHSAPQEALAADLATRLGPGAAEANQSLARHTSLRVGGPAEMLVVAQNQGALQEAITLARGHGIPYRLLGSGSNVLVSDAGLPGLVVINRATAVTFAGLQVLAESGASFSTVARRCVQRGLAGVEWAANIPGTVGGAVFGNAGAWGGDVASALVEATVLEPDGSVDSWPVGRFEYTYRSSVLKRRGTQGNHRRVVLEAVFGLEEGNRADLQARVADIVAAAQGEPAARTDLWFGIQEPTGRSCWAPDRSSRPQRNKDRRGRNLDRACQLCREHGERHCG